MKSLICTHACISRAFLTHHCNIIMMIYTMRHCLYILFGKGGRDLILYISTSKNQNFQADSKITTRTKIEQLYISNPAAFKFIATFLPKKRLLIIVETSSLLVGRIQQFVQELIGQFSIYFFLIFSRSSRCLSGIPFIIWSEVTIVLVNPFGRWSFCRS